MAVDLTLLCIHPDRTIGDAVELLDRNNQGIVVVVNEDHTLIGTVTDGDVRRAMLKGIGMDTPVTRLLERSPNSPHKEPLVARVGTPEAELLHLLNEHKLDQIPLLDDDGRVTDIVTRLDLSSEEPLPINALVMAGGYGYRLRPLTDDTPKPMLEVGGKPLMEHTISQISGAGIHNVYVTTHYRPEKIRNHFGSGDKFGVNLTYLSEEEPLGTAGSLRLLDKPKEPLLVVNGDILTNVNIRSFITFHKEQQASLTVGVFPYKTQVPYGVIEADGFDVVKIIEKPTLVHHVNAGIYLIEPDVFDRIPQTRRFDMPDLIEALIAEKFRVTIFPIREYWIDIGKREDYDRAQRDVNGAAFTK